MVQMRYFHHLKNGGKPLSPEDEGLLMGILLGLLVVTLVIITLIIQ